MKTSSVQVGNDNGQSNVMFGVVENYKQQGVTEHIGGYATVYVKDLDRQITAHIKCGPHRIEAGDGVPVFVEGQFVEGYPLKGDRVVLQIEKLDGVDKVVAWGIRAHWQKILTELARRAEIQQIATDLKKRKLKALIDEPLETEQVLKDMGHHIDPVRVFRVRRIQVSGSLVEVTPGTVETYPFVGTLEELLSHQRDGLEVSRVDQFAPTYFDQEGNEFRNCFQVRIIWKKKIEWLDHLDPRPTVKSVSTNLSAPGQLPVVMADPVRAQEPPASPVNGNITAMPKPNGNATSKPSGEKPVKTKTWQPRVPRYHRLDELEDMAKLLKLA